MIDRNTPSDPRFRERRGDLVGRSALIFSILLVVVMGGAVFVLLGGFQQATPQPSATTASVPSTSVPSPTRSASPRPSPSPAPRSPSPRPASPSPSPQVSTVGTPAQLMLAGEEAGTVVAGAPNYRRRLNNEAAPAGQRWAVVSVTFSATAPFAYQAADWEAQDAARTLFIPAANDVAPALGSGSLTAGGSVTGNVTFLVPIDTEIAALIFTSEAGGDPVTFRVP